MPALPSAVWPGVWEPRSQPGRPAPESPCEAGLTPISVAFGESVSIEVTELKGVRPDLHFY